MKSGYFLCAGLAGLISFLAATAARAAVYPYAEYHLGEGGSLSGTLKLPQDSSGWNRHFSGGFGGANATVSSSVSPLAIGSTASLDTTGPGDQIWSGGTTTSFASLQKDNFAYGIFAKAGATGGGPVLALGDGIGAVIINGNYTGWYIWAYRSQGMSGLSGNFTADTWTHLAVIRSASVTRFYVNGVDQGTPFNETPLLRTPLLSSVIPDEHGGGSFDGQLDEARVVTFSPGESAAKIIAALQGGVVTEAFVTVGSNVDFQKASLSAAEASVFRITDGVLKDSARVLVPDSFSVAGTAPEKHVIQVTMTGLIALGRYPLIDYAGSIGGQGFAGLQLGSLPAGVTAALEENVANSTIDLVISATPGITWTGSGSNVWDVGVSNNWVLDGTSTALPFANDWQVSFDDSTAATTNAVAIAETVSPSFVTVNASENYSFSGAGIGGSAALIKRGTGKLTLTNANTNSGTVTIDGGILSVGDGGAAGSLGSGEIALNGGQLLVNRSDGDFTLTNRLTGTGGIGKLGAGRLVLGSPAVTNAFTGPVTITGGTVVAGRSNLFSGAASVTVAAGATLDAAGFAVSGLTLSGHGVDGQGAVRNANGNLGTVKLGSDASIAVNGTLIGAYFSGDFKLTIKGSGDVIGGADGKDLVLEGLNLFIDNYQSITNNVPGTLTMKGGLLAFGGARVVPTVNVPPTCTKPIVLDGGGISISGGPYQNFSLNVPIRLDGAGGTLRGEWFPTYMTPMGPMPATPLHVSGVVSGSGSLTIGGYGKVHLYQAPAYTGDTIVLGETDGYFYSGLNLQAPGLNDASTVRLWGSLNLSFSGTDVVKRLFYGNVQQAAGVYPFGTGSLTVTEGPTGTPYQLWENSQGIIGAGGNADSDGDGIRNGIEYVLGGDPSGPNSESSALQPSITRDSTHLVFVYRRTDASQANHPPLVKYGTNLSSDWVTAVHGVGGVSIVVANDGYEAGVDQVTVKIPVAGKPELFARLEAGIP